MTPTDRTFHIADDFHPGDVEPIVALHMAYYGPLWGLGPVFEKSVRRGLDDFARRFTPGQDGAWLVRDRDGAPHGSLFIDRRGPEDPTPNRPETAFLRWFIMGERCRGTGLGRRMVAAAAAFCDKKGHDCRLYTFPGLKAARRLYESAGFRLAHETPDTLWGPDMMKQTFIRRQGASWQDSTIKRPLTGAET